jgi:linoleoyl-CoA desaturase
MLFEWGVAVHDLDFEAIKRGEKSKAQIRRELKGIAGKARTQIVKDYIAWPLISAVVNTGVRVGLEAVRKPSRRERLRGRLDPRKRRESTAQRLLSEAAKTYRATVLADATANFVRNIWSYAIIFCGHFPDQTYTFSQEEVENETRGGFYVRQLLGAANIEGGPMFHVASGNLGFQVEHHLYPDMPSTRYAEIAPRVKEICERYELPYNTGPFLKQFGSVQRTILRLALPGGKPRPKPGPFRGDPDTASVQSNGHGRFERAAGPEGSGPEQQSDGVRVSMPKER